MRITIASLVCLHVAACVDGRPSDEADVLPAPTAAERVKLVSEDYDVVVDFQGRGAVVRTKATYRVKNETPEPRNLDMALAVFGPGGRAGRIRPSGLKPAGDQSNSWLKVEVDGKTAELQPQPLSRMGIFSGSTTTVLRSETEFSAGRPVQEKPSCPPWLALTADETNELKKVSTTGPKAIKRCGT